MIVILADLNDAAEVERLWSEATADGRQIDVLVNNAGLGSNGDFADGQNWARELSSINVNMLALTRLVKLAIQHMQAQAKGRILNVAKPMDAAAVAELGWLQARIGKRVVVPGTMNKVFALLPRIAPRGLITRVAAQIMGKAHSSLGDSQGESPAL